MSRLFALLCCTALALAACVKSADPAPTPAGAEGKPPSWDDQSDRDWLYRSQFKTHMRHLWINSNRVASAGRGSAEPTWHEIRAGAEDIRNRARMLGGYWQQLRESTETMLECVEDEDRFGATLEFRELGAACDGCHMATWSPAYLHVTNKVVQGWLANKPTPHGVEEVDDNPPPAIPNRESMKLLWDAYFRTELALEAWNTPVIRDVLKEMEPHFVLRAAQWKGVEQAAETLMQLSRDRKRDGLEDAYNSMLNQCAACHAREAGEAREILMPMPWSE